MEPARSFRFGEHPQWLEPWVTNQLAPRLKQTPSNDRVTAGDCIESLGAFVGRGFCEADGRFSGGNQPTDVEID
jgi:hypothetical protein